jgi:DNA repair protein RadC
LAITDWPEGERPREKLLERGAAALSDAELLAIFLRTGVKGMSAVDLARNLLTRFGGLRGLYGAEPAAIRVPGLGKAKQAQVRAVLELARRVLGEDMAVRDTLGSPAAVRDYLRLKLGGERQEIFLGLFLDAQNRVIAAEELARGTLTQTSVYPREVAKRALHHNAAGLIVAHNHPSGVAEPSQADDHLTRALKEALALLEVRLLDHFIVAGNKLISYAEGGRIF